MWYFLADIFIFFLGASVASFWAVLAYRLPLKLNWWSDRSQCDFCAKKLRAHQLVPVISYLFSSGKCQFCHKKIPSLYFWWEVFLGSWWVIWWQQNNFLLTLPDLATWLLLILGSILIWVALVDWQTQEIANNWLITLALITFSNIILSPVFNLEFIFVKLISSLIMGGSFWLINFLSLKLLKKDGLGSGDAWMVAILAFWLTPKQNLMLFLSSFWLGAIVAIIFLLLKKKKALDHLAFLPFIVISFFIILFFGEQMWSALFY